jgi:hypothetical protein
MTDASLFHDRLPCWLGSANGVKKRRTLLGERVAKAPATSMSAKPLIWSDRVNWARSMGLFWWFAFSFPEGRASSSRSSFERRLISLIFAGRNRIIMIRRELPLTVIASPVEPVA